MSESSAGTFRPGVVLGAYPERDDEPLPLLARAVANAAWRLRPLRCAPRQLASVANSVERASRGLADLSDPAFDAAVLELRKKLHRRGLAQSLVLRGFALIREASRRTLGLPHYDVQLFGGWVMAHCGLAELETGEGKTLMATLPAALAALAGIPVHVITANDYLVSRDASSMAPLYERLGVTVGCVVETDPDRSARRAAYAAGVTYVTNKQVAFDYLRDQIAGADDHRLARSLELELELEPEIDGSAGPVMRGLCFAIVDEADSVLIDDARTPLILSGEGAPADEETVHKALGLAGQLQRGVDYRVDDRRGEIEFTARGRSRLDECGADITGPLSGERRREEWVHRALCAEHLYERDRHYVVEGDSIDIIDLPTGRRAPDRAFESGIQSLIEAREGVSLSPQRETIARISYQRFFRRYLRLASMTGTAREVARELHEIYGLSTAIVPTRRKLLRKALGTRVLASSEEKWRVAVERIEALHATGRPVLVGTSTVATSEHLSELLDRAGLDHALLSARQDRAEADVVARAGEVGRITVATRMAGRGTDIQLTPEVLQLGGLAVLSTELGEARRIDRQLFGRCGRQGAPGSHEQLVSLEDRLIVAHLPRWLRAAAGDWFPGRVLAKLLPLAAQRAEERRSRLARRRMLQGERALGDLLAFSRRRN